MFNPLVSQVVPVANLRPQEATRMLQLMWICYDGVEPNRFYADLQEKQYVILLRVRANDDLVGFSTVQLCTEVLEGRTVEVCFSGDTVIHPDYWGNKALQIAFGRFMLWRKLQRPHRPVLWLLLTKGYKTYFLLVNNFPRSSPRYDVTLPPIYQIFLRRLALSRWPTTYDPVRGVVDFAGSRDRVKPDCAPIDATARENPHVAFFLTRNPGYQRGDELVCLAEMRVRDLFYGIFRATGTQVRHTFRRLRSMLIPWKYAGARL